MPYQIQLDISGENTETEVKEFAQGYDCEATLVLENGPAGGNPLYDFTCDKYSYLEELAEQVIGVIDEEMIKNYDRGSVINY